MSRRLQNASMNQVESGGLSQTPVETTSNGERQQLKVRPMLEAQIAHAGRSPTC
jgi:hypothetical protein